MNDFERFEALCEEEAAVAERGNGEAIGTYGEKRLHRILKRFVCADPNRHEVRVGRYVADVLTEEGITEIQTRSFRPLVNKLRYYLEHTDYAITVLCPVIAEKTIFRIERESGEILRIKRSPKHGRVIDVLPELFWLGELMKEDRLTVEVALIVAEEHRYSDRRYYNREGAFDSELYPRALRDCVLLRTREDLYAFLPEGMESFVAAEYEWFSKLKGRRLYSALNFLCAVGLLRREQDGKRYRYFVVNTM